MLPSFRSLIETCTKQRDAAAAAEIRINVARGILDQALDDYKKYFEDWLTNDLLLAATLLDATQSVDYFLTAPALAGQVAKTWAAVEALYENLTGTIAPVPAAGSAPPPSNSMSALFRMAPAPGGVGAAGGPAAGSSLLSRPPSSNHCLTKITARSTPIAVRRWASFVGASSASPRLRSCE